MIEEKAPERLYEELRSWLPNAQTKPGFVLNSEFAGWDDHVARYVESPTLESYAAGLFQCHEDDLTDEEISEVECYKVGLDTALLRHCRDHARWNARRPLAKNVVVFVHPLYAQLRHGHYTSVQRDSPEALARLAPAFDGALSAPDISRVLIEDIFFYASATSLLTEAGIFDRVIFTMASAGEALDRRSLQALRGRTVFMAGGYNKLCYTSAAQEVMNVVGAEKVWAVSDVTFQSPRLTRRFLNPRTIYREVHNPDTSRERYVPFPKNRVVRLEQVSEVSVRGT